MLDGSRVVRTMARTGRSYAASASSCGPRIAALPARSCLVDGEAIACDANGLSVFDLLRYCRQDDAVTLCAFDLAARTCAGRLSCHAAQLGLRNFYSATNFS